MSLSNHLSASIWMHMEWSIVFSTIYISNQLRRITNTIHNASNANQSSSGSRTKVSLILSLICHDSNHVCTSTSITYDSNLWLYIPLDIIVTKFNTNNRSTSCDTNCAFFTYIITNEDSIIRLIPRSRSEWLYKRNNTNNICSDSRFSRNWYAHTIHAYHAWWAIRINITWNNALSIHTYHSFWTICINTTINGCIYITYWSFCIRI